MIRLLLPADVDSCNDAQFSPFRACATQLENAAVALEQH